MRPHEFAPVTNDRAQSRISLPDLLPRICVRPPYFALHDPARSGAEFSAVARAESPPHGELGPMPAAELGRHAAIAGLSHAALEQRDAKRRYYLATRATCRYRPSDAPYGAPVRFTSRIADLDRRALRSVVRADVAGPAGRPTPLAEFTLEYTILTERAFERLFAAKRDDGAAEGPSPYGRLLIEEAENDGARRVQRVERIPAGACRGHFPQYPALPVAVLMGQLAFLAGRTLDGAPRPFRVWRGDVEASELGWAGDAVEFVAEPTDEAPETPDADGRLRVVRCEARRDERVIGAMRLELEPLERRAPESSVAPSPL